MLGFKYDNEHSNVYNIMAIKTKRVILPDRKHTFIDIPFKNGSVMLPDNTAPDIIIPVDVCIKPNITSSIYDVGRNIARWLNKSEKKRLIFDDDPNYYYEAICVSSVTIEDVKIGEFTINFRCSPEMKAVS